MKQKEVNKKEENKKEVVEKLNVNELKMDKIKKEIFNLGILLIIGMILFKIIFYKENMLVVIRLVLSLFYLIVVPGHFIMIYWIDRLDFKERIVLGIVVGTVVVGLLSYYLGLIGLHVKYHFVPLPLAVILISILLNKLFKRG